MELSIRPYNSDNDFDVIKSWLSDERTHAMWCANRTAFPIQKDGFAGLLEDVSVRCGDKPYVATVEDDRVVGFFCYSLDQETKEGMLKFVVVDSSMRGMGLGKQMLRQAVRYAFDETDAEAVQLMVFSENERARHCYENIGFIVRQTDQDAFQYQDESWERCNMILIRNHTNDNKDCVSEILS